MTSRQAIKGRVNALVVAFESLRVFRHSVIGELQMQGKLPAVVEQYLASQAKLWLRLRCAQHDAEHAGAEHTGTRGVDARWYAPSLSWLWLHWRSDKPFVEPDAPASVLSDARMAIEAHCNFPKDERYKICRSPKKK